MSLIPAYPRLMTALAAALIATFSVACETEPPEMTPIPPKSELEAAVADGVVTRDEMAPHLENAQRMPNWLLVQATEPHEDELRPVPKREEVAESLETDPRLEPLAEALTAAGYSTDEQVDMIALAGRHNSMHPGDSVRARRGTLHAEVDGAVREFDRQLQTIEAAHGARFDREAMRELGILTHMKSTGVPK